MKTKTKAKSKLTVRSVAMKIRWPSGEWIGNCYAVAVAMVEKKLVDGGVARYGHWRGPVSPNCPVTQWATTKLPFVQHGWIERPDGTVVDPTRWVFEGVPAYIYDGPNDHYDVGGNRFRAELLGPCPAYSTEAPRARLNVWQHSARAQHFVMRHMFGGAPGVTQEMAHWLANQPPDYLGEHAKAIYKALIDAGLKAAIPIDNRRLVLDE